MKKKKIPKIKMISSFFPYVDDINDMIDYANKTDILSEEETRKIIEKSEKIKGFINYYEKTTEHEKKEMTKPIQVDIEFFYNLIKEKTKIEQTLEMYERKLERIRKRKLEEEQNGNTGNLHF